MNMREKLGSMHRKDRAKVCCRAVQIFDTGVVLTICTLHMPASDYILPLFRWFHDFLASVWRILMFDFRLCVPRLGCDHASMRRSLLNPGDPKFDSAKTRWSANVADSRAYLLP